MLAIVQMTFVGAMPRGACSYSDFCGSGPRWDEFPMVKEELKHEAKDDGKENIPTSLFH